MDFIFGLVPAYAVGNPNELETRYGVNFGSDIGIGSGHLVGFATAIAVKINLYEVGFCKGCNNKIETLIIGA